MDSDIRRNLFLLLWLSVAQLYCLYTILTLALQQSFILFTGTDSCVNEFIEYRYITCFLHTFYQQCIGWRAVCRYWNYRWTQWDFPESEQIGSIFYFPFRSHGFFRPMQLITFSYGCCKDFQAGLFLLFFAERWECKSNRFLVLQLYFYFDHGMATYKHSKKIYHYKFF